MFIFHKKVLLRQEMVYIVHNLCYGSLADAAWPAPLPRGSYDERCTETWPLYKGSQVNVPQLTTTAAF